MTDDLITQAEAALEGVTEGPWLHWGGGDVVDHVVAEQQIGEDYMSYPTIADDIGSPADAEFIAAARTFVPDLVAALKAAQADKVCDSCEQSVHELVSGDNGESWVCINCVASIAKSRSNWWRRSDGR